MCYNTWCDRKNARSLGVDAGVAEQADARDLKSRDAKASYRFDPGHRHQGMISISQGRAVW